MINGAFASFGMTAMQTRSRLSTITDSRNDMTKLKNIHPGEILLEEFLAPMEISQNALARGIAVPPRRINEIVLGKRAVTADSQGIPVVDHNSIAPCPLFWHLGAVLDETPVRLRPGRGPQATGPED